MYLRKPLKGIKKKKLATRARRTRVVIYMKSNYLLSILLSLRITYTSWIIHSFAPPPPPPVPQHTLHAAPDGRTRERESRTRREQKKGGRQTGKRRSTSMVLMHKTCIFTKPVFTDVNTRYARGTRKESRVAVAGKEREDRIASRRATPFIYFTPADG